MWLCTGTTDPDPAVAVQLVRRRGAGRPRRTRLGSGYDDNDDVHYFHSQRGGGEIPIHFRLQYQQGTRLGRGASRARLTFGLGEGATVSNSQKD